MFSEWFQHGQSMDRDCDHHWLSKDVPILELCGDGQNISASQDLNTLTRGSSVHVTILSWDGQSISGAIPWYGTTHILP